MMEEKIPRQSQQYRLEQMDNENLLYSTLHTKTIYLNSSATLVWSLCDGKNAIGDIIELLEQSYPDSKQQIRIDVMNTIEKLTNNQAIILE